jgi:glycosyltransferase involved in cell wall biosynthesis
MIYALFHDLQPMAKRASFVPLMDLIDCRVIPYHAYWMPVERISWGLGTRLRGWGIRYYGSFWNWFMPYGHERLLSWESRGAGRGDVVHFMMAELGSPRHPEWFNRRGAKLVGTFHCSARRLPSVLLEGYQSLNAFDRISVMSKTQIPFFVGRGYPAEKIDVTLHGVDCDYFRPAPRPVNDGGPLKLLLVGSTERDHVFAAEVMRRLDPAVAHLSVLTAAPNRRLYDGLPQVTCLDKLSDEQLIVLYQQADLLFMPVLDCTANNVVLESMACGTPVMSNRVGGMEEYVDAKVNFLYDAKDADAWAHQLTLLHGEQETLNALRPRVRVWAEGLDWRVVKRDYLKFYEAAVRDGR